MPVALEEPEIIPATKSSHGFLGTFISENIAVREEDGTLIIVGVPIARTGWQSYSVSNLPQQKAQELGIDVSNPSASIDLYRPASEVFDPEFLSSLNGVPITDGHPPGGVFRTGSRSAAHGLRGPKCSQACGYGRLEQGGFIDAL